MKNWLYAVVLGVVQSAVVHAEPALFKDSVLHVEDSIVVLDEQIHYYRNLQFLLKDNGDFRVVQGEALNLAQIDELSIAVYFTNPRQVELTVTGMLSTPCMDAVTSVKRQGDTFYVAVAENVWQTFDVCTQVLTPFEVSLNLDVSDLALGDYLVKVNDQYIELELE